MLSRRTLSRTLLKAKKLLQDLQNDTTNHTTLSFQDAYFNIFLTSNRTTMCTHTFGYVLCFIYLFFYYFIFQFCLAPEVYAHHHYNIFSGHIHLKSYGKHRSAQMHIQQNLTIHFILRVHSRV